MFARFGRHDLVTCQAERPPSSVDSFACPESPALHGDEGRGAVAGSRPGDFLRSVGAVLGEREHEVTSCVSADYLTSSKEVCIGGGSAPIVIEGFDGPAGSGRALPILPQSARPT